MRLLLICVALRFLISAHGVSYFVRTDGTNTNDGLTDSAAGAWRNIWYAANTVSAGDTVIVGSGEFNEFVTNTVSGSVGNPITFVGTRGVAGEWLTIIDPSTPMTNGWIEAAEIGSGVWKQTNTAFTVRELTLDHHRLAFILTNGFTTEIAVIYDTTNTTGAEMLGLPSDYPIKTKFSGTPTVYFWDGIEAMFCSTGSVCYLRLRDGSDPNGVNIRAAPNDPTEITSNINRPAINIVDQSYLVYSNLLVRGAWGQIFMAGLDAHHNTIESNYLQGGYARIVCGTESHDNIFRNNQIVSGYYGYTNLGAWEGGTTSNYYTREVLYSMSKYLEGSGSTMEDGIKLDNAGSNNVISCNLISGSLGNGISIFHEVTTGKPYTINTECYSNTVEKSVSVGLMFMEGQIGTKIHGNLVSDCNINMRFHHMDTTETNRTIYIYRNRFWLPDDVGDQIYAHYNDTNAASYFPEFWVYNNSFSAGANGITPSGFADEVGGMTNCYFINNIFSDAPYAGTASLTMNFWTNSFMIGLFDYNLVTPPPITYPSSDDPAWFGTNNVKATTIQWFNSEGMSFALTNGSPAINAGMDIPTTYPDLPQDGTVKIGTAWDMGALEYEGFPILRVGNLFSAPK